MIVPFVIGTYGTSNVPSKYSVKEQKIQNTPNTQMILNKQRKYFEH